MKKLSSIQKAEGLFLISAGLFFLSMFITKLFIKDRTLMLGIGFLVYGIYLFIKNRNQSLITNKKLGYIFLAGQLFFIVLSIILFKSKTANNIEVDINIAGVLLAIASTLLTFFICYKLIKK